MLLMSLESAPCSVRGVLQSKGEMGENGDDEMEDSLKGNGRIGHHEDGGTFGHSGCIFRRACQSEPEITS